MFARNISIVLMTMFVVGTIKCTNKVHLNPLWALIKYNMAETIPYLKATELAKCQDIFSIWLTQ